MELDHKKKGGPYTKDEKRKRLEEVYRLHFEYGYPARKISELIKINRNTINGDISYWYSKTVKNNKIFDPEQRILIILERMDLQRTRLVETLHDKTILHEKIQIERMILDVDHKIASIHQRLAESTRRVIDLAVKHANNMLATTKCEKRYITTFDKMRVSEKSCQTIGRVINEDLQRPR